jgi:radical SAM superfamily enzyme YgiQ (UPF0313 family)
LEKQENPMKITLILAASRSDPLRKTEPFTPLALPLLAATAPDHEYHLVDLMWEDEVDFNRPADLVGISVKLTAENRAYEIAHEFRKRGVRVVLGGPQVSAVPHRAKKHADAVAVGEGEPLWPVIVRDAGENRLQDFYVCSPEDFDGRGRSVFQVKSHADLSAVPRPLVHLWKRKYPFDTVFAVRGCHVDCDFCSVTGFFGKKYRRRPIPHVLDEIRGFKDKYYLIDDTVFGRETTYDYYLELYGAMAGLDRKRYWTGQANLDAASSPRGREVIKAAAGAGLFYAAVGIESIKPSVLKSSGAFAKMGVRRDEDALDRIRENIRFIQDQGIIVSGWFVIGYEDDRIDTYYETLEFCKEMHLLPAIFPVKVLPGTRLFDRLKAENKLDENRLFNFVHPTMGDDEIHRALAAVRSDGFSLAQNLRRARFYASRFKSDRIEKTIFLLILQSKLGRGLDISRDEFYVDRLNG